MMITTSQSALHHHASISLIHRKEKIFFNSEAFGKHRPFRKFSSFELVRLFSNVSVTICDVLLDEGHA